MQYTGLAAIVAPLIRTLILVGGSSMRRSVRHRCSGRAFAELFDQVSMNEDGPQEGGARQRRAPQNESSREKAKRELEEMGIDVILPPEEGEL